MKNNYIMTLEEANAIMKYNGGNLDLKDNRDVVELPEGLVVKGYLDISYTRITKLPNNLYVGGDLSAYNSLLAELPSGLVVCDAIGISNTAIKEIPEDIFVGDALWLPEGVDKLPDNLIVGDSISFHNKDSYIVCNNLFVGHNIYLHGKDFDVSSKVKRGGFCRNMYYVKFENENIGKINIGDVVYGYHGKYIAAYAPVNNDIRLVCVKETKHRVVFDDEDFYYYDCRFTNDVVITDGAYYVVFHNYKKEDMEEDMKYAVKVIRRKRSEIDK